jgi:hypothetical protein
MTSGRFYFGVWQGAWHEEFYEKLQRVTGGESK